MIWFLTRVLFSFWGVLGVARRLIIRHVLILTRQSSRERLLGTAVCFPPLFLIVLHVSSPSWLGHQSQKECSWVVCMYFKNVGCLATAYRGFEPISHQHANEASKRIWCNHSFITPISLELPKFFPLSVFFMRKINKYHVLVYYYLLLEGLWSGYPWKLMEWAHQQMVIVEAFCY